MNHSPNKLEMILLIFVVSLSIFSTVIIMSKIDLTGISLSLDFFIFFIFTVLFIIAYQEIVNIFYLRWQKK